MYELLKKTLEPFEKAATAIEAKAHDMLLEVKKSQINSKLKDLINLNDLAHNIREVNKANGWGLGEPRFCARCAACQLRWQLLHRKRTARTWA